MSASEIREALDADRCQPAGMLLVDRDVHNTLWNAAEAWADYLETRREIKWCVTHGWPTASGCEAAIRTNTLSCRIVSAELTIRED